MCLCFDSARKARCMSRSVPRAHKLCRASQPTQSYTHSLCSQPAKAITTLERPHRSSCRVCIVRALLKSHRLPPASSRTVVVVVNARARAICIHTFRRVSFLFSCRLRAKVRRHYDWTFSTCRVVCLCVCLCVVKRNRDRVADHMNSLCIDAPDFIFDQSVYQVCISISLCDNHRVAHLL